MMRHEPHTHKLHLELDVAALKHLDPLSILSQLILECPDVEKKRFEVYTILSELCSNALEHGILHLDSALKSSISGIADYYTERRLKLEALEKGFIKIDILVTLDVHASQGILSIMVCDSGPGFHHQDRLQDLHLPTPGDLRKLSGRGVALVSSLCDSIEYMGSGNQVKAVYHWAL